MTEPIVVTAVFGSYVRYLPACFESLFQHGHTEVILVTDGGRYEVVDQLMAWSTAKRDVAVTLISCADDVLFRRVAEGMYPNHAKLAAWMHAMRLVPIGRRFVCLDIDSLVREPLGLAFEQASMPRFTLAIPRSLRPRGGSYIYRPSLVIGTGATVVGREFDAWLRETLRLTSLDQRVIAERHGSALAGALDVLASKAEDSGSSLIAQLPGPTWAAEVSPFAGAAVVHFRGSKPSEHALESNWTGVIADWHRARDAYAQRLGVSRERVS